MGNHHHWQYQSRFEPLGEVVTTEKWHPNANQPVVRKIISIALIAGSLFFVQPIAAAEAITSICLDSPNATVSFFKRFLYQAKAEPIPFEFAAETVTLDKWSNDPPGPQRHSERRPEFLPSFSELRQPEPPIDGLHQPVNVPSLKVRQVIFAGPVLVEVVSETITPDKWHPLISQPRRPVYEVIILDYHKKTDTQVQVPSAPEVITLDKWFRRTETPLFDIPRNQHLNPFFFKEPSTPLESFGWHPETSKPRFQMLPRDYAYPWLFEDLTQILVLPDRWLPFLPDQILAKARLIEGIIVIDPTAMTAVEIVTMDKWFQEWSKPRFVSTRHYLYPPSAKAEAQPEPPPESWLRDTEQPPSDKARLQKDFPFSFMPERQPDVAPDSWLQDTERPRWEKERRLWLYPSQFHDASQPEPRVSSWHRDLESPPNDIARTQHGYPNIFQDFTQLLVFPERWLPSMPDAIAAKARGVEGLIVIDPTALTPAEVITLDKWLMETSQPATRKQLRQFLSNWMFAEDRQPEPRPEAVHRGTEIPVRDIMHRQHSFPTLFKDLLQPEPPKGGIHRDTEIPPRDRERAQFSYPHSFREEGQPEPAQGGIQRDIELPPRDKVRGQYAYPTMFREDRQPEPPRDSWLRDTNAPVFHVKHRGHEHPHVFIEPSAPIPPFDSWFRPTEAKMHDRERLQHLHENIFADPTIVQVFVDKWGQPIQQPIVVISTRQSDIFQIFVIVEPITLDKWFRELSAPRMDAARLQHLYPTLKSDPTTPLESFGWHPEIETPPRKMRDQRWTYPDLVFDPTLLFVNLDRWGQPVVQPVFVPGRAQTGPFAFLVDRFDFGAEVVTLDKWFRETIGPPFDRARLQHLYPSFERHATTPLESLAWHPETGRKPQEQPTRTWSYPTTFQDLRPIVAALETWFQALQQPIFARRRASQEGIGFVPQQIEVITLDKWLREIAQPTGRIRQALADYLAADLSPRVPFEWMPEISTPSRAPEVIRVSLIQPAFFDPRTTPSLDQWLQALQDPVKAAGRVPWLEAQAFIDKPILAPMDLWFVQASEPVRQLARAAFFQALSIDSQAEFGINMDTWFREVVQPLFDLSRNQWLLAQTLAWHTVTPAPPPADIFLDYLVTRFADVTGRSSAVSAFGKTVKQIKDVTRRTTDKKGFRR